MSLTLTFHVIGWSSMPGHGCSRGRSQRGHQPEADCGRGVSQRGSREGQKRGRNGRKVL